MALGDSEEREQGGSGLKKFVLGLTVLLVLAVGARLFFVMKARHDAENAKAPEEGSHHLIADDYIVPKKKYQNTMADAKELNGKRIWVFAGGQITPYAATATHVDFAHPGGLLLGAEPLDVVNFIEQAAPASLYSRIPKGDRQVFMLFHRPSAENKLFGAPVGYRDSSGYTFYLDEAFFYDDPHVLYKHWPAEIWKAVDEHKAVLGMNELQAQLALGQVSKPGDGKPNNRTVTFNNDGHPVDIVFQDGKATKITPE